MLRTLRNLVVGTAIISSATQASSISTSPRDWVPLPDVVSATMEGDRSQAAYLFARCAGLLFTLVKSFQTRADSGEISNRFQTQAANMAVSYMSLREDIGGYSIETIEERMDEYNEVVIDFSESYQELFTQNWHSTGSYFSGDPQLEEEIQLCSSFADAME